jgi:hypothetical protein
MARGWRPSTLISVIVALRRPTEDRTMRALGFLFADLALGQAQVQDRSLPDAPDDGFVWNEERAAAWRAWRLAGERESDAKPAPDRPAPRLAGPQPVE